MAQVGNDRPKRTWLSRIAEVVAIVVSILLAFAIDAGWDARLEGIQERRVIVGLEEEFAAYVETIERSVSQSDVSLRRLRYLFADQALDFGEIPADSLDSAFWTLLYAPTWDRASGARDALVGSGRLELLEDEDLRARLQQWQGVKEELLDNQLSVRTYVLEILVPFLSDQGIPLVRVLPYQIHADAPPEASEPLRMPDLTPELVNVYRRTISDSEFQGLLAYRYFWEVSSSRKYREVLALAKTILGLLAEKSG